MEKKQLNHWYALYTSPRAEKQVEERLKKKGITCYLPIHRARRVWSDRVKIVDMPLFNSYIFVHCAENELRDLLKVYGVVRIVYYDGKPAIVRPKEIEAVREFLELAENQTLCVGEEVEILTGAMKSVSGKIKKIKKNYLVLFLEQLGAIVMVKIEEVAKVKRLK
ncbi:MAG: UpxY family transcription antiterminator [Tannerellaceae bacterium]|nr:UpxY family transcription antiterminator [Tannerellaceae bacterium]MCD8044469.1 UpxY family transcription antiterminator [Tannerellaceae bacterium]MCD8176153.1 UpxY family transcription antiterminator [Tannerellaceae bacterium]